MYKKTKTEKDIKRLAKLLRKPQGKKGVELAKAMNEGNRSINLHTLAVLDAQANESILEIGMGNGFFVQNILNLDETIRYTGCDYSKEMVKAASKINKALVKSNQAKFICGDIKYLPFPKKSFDKIFTINTFYFWDEHGKVLQQLRSVLKKGAQLIIAIRPKEYLDKSPFAQHGFTTFSTKKIGRLLQKNGFKQVEITKIEEPQQERWGKAIEKKAIIIKAQK